MKKNKSKSRSNEYDDSFSDDWVDDDESDNDIVLKDDDFECVELNKDNDDDEEESDNKLPEGYSLELTGENFGYLRYRNSHIGRFSNPYEIIDPEREKEKEADRKIDKFLKDYRRKVNLPTNVRILLLKLVNNFENVYDIYDCKISDFKRIRYHKVLLDHRLKRSAFSLFIKRLVAKGYIRKIKHGHKLYLKITELGLKKIIAFYEEFMIYPFM